MKKLFLLIPSFLLLTTCLVGCQKKQPAITEEAAKSETQEAPQKTFTLEELAQYNGQDDSPAYVAVDGVVYDVSLVFTKGKHYQHLAGKELTKDFYSYHAKKSIEKYPVVGELVK